MNEFTPTKTNLDRAKRYLAFSISSHALLDRKRKVLIQEMMMRIDQAKKDGEILSEKMNAIYEYVKYANVIYGSYEVEELSHTIPTTEDPLIIYRSVMGVPLADIQTKEETLKESYGLFRSGINLDRALEQIAQTKAALLEFVELENAISHLAREIKKTEKRVNSIEKIQIPKYRQIVKNIEDALEEKEREDLFRLKIVKKKRERQKDTAFS